MTVKRKISGIKIPDIFIRNDGDDSTTGHLTISAAGTNALELTGSAASIAMSGTSPVLNLAGGGATIYLATPGGTVGTISWAGAGHELLISIAGTTGTIINL